MWHMGLGINKGIGERDEGQYDAISKLIVFWCLYSNKFRCNQEVWPLDHQFFTTGRN